MNPGSSGIMTGASDSLSIASTKEKQDLMGRAYSLVHYERAAASGIDQEINTASRIQSPFSNSYLLCLSEMEELLYK